MSIMALQSQRVVALIDMDCFEAQIWQRMYPEYWSLPCVVSDGSGRIVSVTYEARELGISRDIRLREAKRIANEAKVQLKVFDKPNDREKPDGKTLRYASWEVVDALKEYCQTYAYGVVMEYASIDEFYLDISEEVSQRISFRRDYTEIIESKTFLETKHDKVGGDGLKVRLDKVYPIGDPEVLEEKRLVYGALILQDISNFVFSKTKFNASCGIATNKLMAKLACSLNKPNGITIFPHGALPRVSKTIDIAKIPGFGGKFGARLQEIFNVKTMSQLAGVSFEDLEQHFELEKALDAYYKSRGLCDEPVHEKLRTGEVSCGKNFIGQITSDETLKYHLFCLAEEMVERLEEELFRHRRKPQFLRVQYTYTHKNANARDPGSLLNGSWTTQSTEVTANQLTDKAVNAVLNHLDCCMSTLQITRLCITAKAFESVQ